MSRKILLSIAGYDPSGGAGVILDLNVFQHLGFRGMAILISLTAQNSKSVAKVKPLPSQFVKDQYVALSSDISFSGVKIGMLGSQKNIKVLAKILDNCPDIPKIADPVFRSSSGAWFLEKEAIPAYVVEIGQRVSLLTPNLYETYLISRVRVKNVRDMKEAAKIIFDRTGSACLIKGGHLADRTADVLFDGSEFHLFEREKFPKKVHGTGCFLSSSILCFLAKGHSLEKACSLAGELTHKAIKNAGPVGRGQAFISFPL